MKYFIINCAAVIAVFTATSIIQFIVDDSTIYTVALILSLAFYLINYMIYSIYCELVVAKAEAEYLFVHFEKRFSEIELSLLKLEQSIEAGNFKKLSDKLTELNKFFYEYKEGTAKVVEKDGGQK